MPVRYAAIGLLVGMLFGGPGWVQPPAAAPLAAAVVPQFATWVVLDGAIGPATSRFVERTLDGAARRHSVLVILQLDTPGGLDTSMRDIIKAILASPVPVVTYVAPEGARAASAGTYILYASHLAAMAPATNLGAATPVSIGGDSGRPPSPIGNAPDKAAPQAVPPATETTLERKAINDAVSYIRALAELRGRDAAFAESAVRSAASLTASEALQQHVIELIAKDVPDLLRQAHGRKLKVAGRDIVLDTSNLMVQRITPDWRTQLLSVLTHPTIAYGLLLIGIYGLLLEGYNPGAILPGVVGAISLLLALYGFQLLSVNYAGLGLMAVGVGLMITEFFVPAFGSLVIGGMTAFVIGSIILLDTDVPGLQIARPLIYGVAISAATVALAIVFLAARAQRRPASAGVEAMIGTTAEVIGEFTKRGVVRYGGELWNAQAEGPLCAGQRVRIVGIDGLVLSVEPLSSHS